MADNVSVDNAELSGYVVSTEELADSSHVQNFQLVTVTGTAKEDLAKAEDTAAVSGDFGLPILFVRQDTPAALAADNGDYTFASVDSTGSVYVAVNSIPAAARTTDSIAFAAQTDAIMNGLSALTPKFFSESVAAADTDEELIAAVALKKLRILALAVQCGGTATDITFESSTTTRKHKIPAGINGGQILPFNPCGWFETASGESLTVTTGAGSTVEISGQYVEV